MPVIRTDDGETLDGHHREQIAAELGITDIPVKVVTGLGDEERRHMRIRLNADRRQLTGEQKRHLIREELRRSQPDISNNWLAELLGVDDKTVQAVRIEEEAAGTIEPVTVFRCKDGKKRKYRRTARQQKVAAEVKQQEAPAVLASSTTSDEPHRPCRPNLPPSRRSYLCRRASRPRRRCRSAWPVAATSRSYSPVAWRRTGSRAPRRR